MRRGICKDYFTSRYTLRKNLYVNLASKNILSWRQARTQDIRFNPRFGHTTKVSYSPLRSPQRTGSFSTLILQKPTTKVKAISSYLSSMSGWYKLLGVPQIWRLPSNLKRSWNLGFQEHQESTRGVCTSSSLFKKRWERKAKSWAQAQTSHPRAPPTRLNLEEDLSVREMGERSALSQVRWAINV
jgi:hypothetical protein